MHRIDTHLAAPRPPAKPSLAPSLTTRGYTVIELLMALTVLAIGVSGIIAMETATATSNRHAKNLAIASHIAQSWVDQLEAEAGQWNTRDDFSATDWLIQVQTQPDEWFKPDTKTQRQFGAAFDAVGNSVAESNAQFCANLKLTWLFNQNDGSGVIRAEVRVFWPRTAVPDPAQSIVSNLCAHKPIDFDNPNYRRGFHFVYASSAIRQYRGAL